VNQESRITCRVLAFARESGGAQAIAPVIKELQNRGASILVLAKDVAEKIFMQHGLSSLYLEDGESCFIDPLLSQQWGLQSPDIVLTSAASLPELDMTEKNLWRWALHQGIPSVAVLDQWQNYARRFSSCLTSDMAFLPEMCCVMDKFACSGMLAESFPPERLVITGQPAFDILCGTMTAEAESAVELKRNMGMDNGRPTLVFIGEAIGRHLGGAYGYDESAILNHLLDILKEMEESPNLIIKKHPQNVDEDFDLDAVKRASERMVVKIVGMEHPSKPVVLSADIVVGMSSVLLVESILLGKITVSLEIGAKVFNKCFPVHIGSIPLIVTKEKARSELRDLILKPEKRAEWLAAQSQLAHLPGAAQRVADVVLRMLQH